MLTTKLQFDGFDKTGRVLNLHDSTGIYDATTNPGGWGAPNKLPADVQKVIFTVSYISGDVIGTQTYVRVPDPLHPEWLTTPTIEQITGGAAIVITSLSLKTSTIDQGLLAFKDGVFDLNMYDVMTEVTGVTGTKGTIFLTGIDFTQYYEADSVVIGNEIYDIDKSLPTNNYTVLYLTKALLVDTTTFSPAYRSNTKALNYAGVNCRVQYMAAKLPGICDHEKNEDLVDIYRLVVDGIQASFSLFNCQNYIKADALVSGSYRAANRSWGGCGCGC